MEAVLERKPEKVQNQNTLSSVKSILPPELFQRSTAKGLLYFFQDLVLFVGVITLLWNVQSWYWIALLWWASGIVISGLFIIGHDAAHGSLFKSEKLNWWVGQIAMLPSLHAFNQWAYGHNRIHHGHTIKWQGDFVWHPTTPAEYRKKSIFGKLLHKFYWSILGTGFYYMIEVWLKGMILYTAPIAKANRDKLIIISFALGSIAAVAYFGGQTDAGFSASQAAWMVTKILLVPFIIWNYAIGFTVYIHHIGEDIAWKESKEWTPFHGQMVGTVNFHINPIMNLVMHNIYIHLPHHVHMKIPFYHLPKALEEIKKHYGEFVVENWNIFAYYMKASKKCKLFDPEKGEWLTYKEASVAE